LGSDIKNGHVGRPGITGTLSDEHARLLLASTIIT